jgi:hypothetical protein
VVRLTLIRVGVTLMVVFGGWSPATAGVRHPVVAKDLWPGEVSSVAVDARGDVYVTGSCCFRQREHMVVRRYARGGGLVWERTLHRKGRYAFARGRDVAVGTDGTVYVVGVLSLKEGWDEGSPTVATFLRAYGPRGALRWQRVYSIAGYLDPVPTAIAAGPGFVVVTGYTSSFESVEHEGWIRAWNPSGRLLWVDDFELCGIAERKRDMPNDVATDRAGSIYVVGVVDRLENEYGGQAPADSEVVVRRMTSSGGTVWTRLLSDRSKDDDVATSVDVLDGRVVVGALFGGGWGGTAAPHPWLRAYSTTGRVVWTRVWPGGSDWFEDLGVTLGPGRRAYVAWSAERGVRLKALAERGRLRWSARVAARGEVDLDATGGRVRLVGVRGSYARLITFRA